MVTDERYTEIVRQIEEIRNDGFVVAFVGIESLNSDRYEDIEERMVQVALDYV